MSEATIKYNGSTIASVDGGGSVTLATQGKYMSGNVTVEAAESGGTPSYTLLASQEFEISTTSTSATTIGTVQATAAAYTSEKILYVRVKDKAGARAGHFVSSDTFIVNSAPARDSTATFTSGVRITVARNSYDDPALFWNLTPSASTAGYGVYAYSVTSEGDIDIRARYDSTRSRTIDGTYVVEVYLLDWPDSVCPFLL